MRVLVVAGASGGHIFPALGFLETLKDKHNNIDALLVLPKRSIKTGISTGDCRVKYISISGLALRFDFKNFVAILRFLKGSLESLILLLEFRPDIVVGFGSLDSLPLLLLAHIFRIKTLIHEQNVIPGRANRLLAKFSDRVAVSFTETKDHLEVNSGKIVLTGNPIRKSLKRIDRDKALEFFGFSDDKLTVLVMGGSQGSHTINTGFLEAASMMKDVSRLQIIHLTGTIDHDALTKGYKNLSAEVKLFTFLKDMQYAYSISDLVIARAGATTIAELIFFRLAAVIVPYPYAYKHQLSNADFLERNGCALIIKDSEFNGGKLRKIMEDFMDNPEKIMEMRSRYIGIQKHDANNLLVEEVLSLN